MAAIESGLTGAVQGRLPHGWRIAARYDRDTGVVEVTSPDTDRFYLHVDVSQLDEYSPTHKPTSGVLEDACLEAKYDAESGVLRYDTAEVPEFWLEVRTKAIININQPSFFTSTSASHCAAATGCGRSRPQPQQTSSKKKKKLGLPDYPWEPGEKAVTICLADMRGLFPTSSVTVPLKLVPYYARMAMYRTCPTTYEHNWDITNHEAAECGLFEQLEKCDYHAWKCGRQFTKEEEDEMSEEDRDLDLLSDEQRVEIKDHLHAWYVRMCLTSFNKLPSTPVLLSKRIHLFHHELE